jgi:hypothetical protein
MKAEVQRAQPYLDTLLQQSPEHPEAPAFLNALRQEDRRGETAPTHEASSLQQRLRALWGRITR